MGGCTLKREFNSPVVIAHFRRDFCVLAFKEKTDMVQGRNGKLEVHPEKTGLP